MIDELKSIRTMIAISDMHTCCQLGLCPPEGIDQDAGGKYIPSGLQMKIWGYWRYFWDEWVPMATQGEEYVICINGDLTDGEHHGSKHQVTTNVAVQTRVATELIQPLTDRKECKGLYITRGSRAHDGTSGETCEMIARALDAIPDDNGNHARFELWKYLGGDDALIHAMHHVGTTSSSAYELTAVYKELVEAFVEAGRWGDRPPDVTLRSHRHRYSKAEIANYRDRAMSVVTPAWQGKTPFTFKIAGARQSQPQFGGLMLRMSNEGELYERHYVERLDRPTPE